MSLELEVNVGAGVSIELGELTFDRLLGLSLDQVRSQPISINGFPATLGEGFKVTGATSEASCRMVGDCRRVHGVGARLKRFNLCIESDVGDRLGAGMRSGTIEVRGDAGHFMAAANRGERTGMRGGLIAVAGKTGQYCGYRMRRGIVVIGAAADRGLAAEMIAGTIFVGQPDFAGIGIGMRRGTIVVLGDASGPLEGLLAGQVEGKSPPSFAKFSEPSPVDIVFRGLLAGYWKKLCQQFDIAGLNNLKGGDDLLEIFRHENWQRVIGDRGVDGLGEIWFEGQTTC